MTPIYIGDELSAAGYRLAGLRVRTPSPEQTAEVFRWALTETDLILLGVEQARQIPGRELEQAMCAPSPQIMIMPDIHLRVPMRNLSTRIRAELGMRA